MGASLTGFPSPASVYSGQSRCGELRNGTRARTGRRTLHGCPLSLSRSPPAHTHVPRFIAFGHLLPPPCVSLCALSGGAVCSSQAPLHRHQLLTPSLSPFESPPQLFLCGTGTCVYFRDCVDCTVWWHSMLRPLPDPLPPMLYREASGRLFSVCLCRSVISSINTPINTPKKCSAETLGV